MSAIATRLSQHNPITVLIRPEIEAVWQTIVETDNWEPFYQLVQKLQKAVEP